MDELGTLAFITIPWPTNQTSDQISQILPNTCCKFKSFTLSESDAFFRPVLPRNPPNSPIPFPRHSPITITLIPVLSRPFYLHIALVLPCYLFCRELYA